MVTRSRRETGNLRYDLWEDQGESGRFVTDELYVDSLAVNAHHDTPHYRNYLSRINDLAERRALVLDPISVDAHGQNGLAFVHGHGDGLGLRLTSSRSSND